MFHQRTMRAICCLTERQTANDIRRLHSSPMLYKAVPKNLKGKNRSAQDWLTRQLNDIYVKQSRYHNYRARSAYKLIEIDDKYSILKPGMIVVDCGAAPGSWTQVAVQRVNADGKMTDVTGESATLRGSVVSLDIIPFEPVAHAVCLPEMDILTEECSVRLESVLSGLKCAEEPNQQRQLVDIVLSDMAPAATGHKAMDHDNVIKLCYAALKFAVCHLSAGGTFLCKLWDGSRTRDLYSDSENLFQNVRYVKPLASRNDSAEIYLLATKFRGIK